MLPPCTRVEDTVLDLIQIAPTFEDALRDGSAGPSAAGARPPTGYARPWTLARRCAGAANSQAALGDAGEGALSLLEYRYAHRVERPHGLPAARRQARIRHRTGNRYLDNLYEEYGVCAELDGTAAHPADEQWRDKRRDNANAARGIVTLQVRLRRPGKSPLRDRGSRRYCATPAWLAGHSPFLPPPRLLHAGGIS